MMMRQREIKIEPKPSLSHNRCVLEQMLKLSFRCIPYVQKVPLLKFDSKTEFLPFSEEIICAFQLTAVRCPLFGWNIKADTSCRQARSEGNYPPACKETQ